MPRFFGVKPYHAILRAFKYGIQTPLHPASTCILRKSVSVGLSLRARLFFGGGIRAVAVQTVLADIILNVRRHKPVYRSAARKPLPQLGR